MSNYIKAKATKIAKGSPVSNDVETVKISETGTMNSTAGVGGALTYFNSKFEDFGTDGVNYSIHRVEAIISNLSDNPKANEATGYLDGKLKSANEDADVEIQSYLFAEMSSKEEPTDSDFVFVNVKAHNNDTISHQFDSDIVNAEIVMSGFNISYQNDHNIKRFTATTENEDFNNSGLFSFKVDTEISDDSGHTGGGDFYATLIGYKVANPSWKKTTWNPNEGEITVKSSGSTALQDAYVFAQGVFMKYTGGEDHKVKKITINTGSEKLYISTNEQNSDGGYDWAVTFKPNLTMKDNSGNSESQGSSYIDLLVVFVPK